MSAALDPSCFKAVHKKGGGLELVQVTYTVCPPVILYCPGNPGWSFSLSRENHFTVLWLQLPQAIHVSLHGIPFPEEVANLGYSFNICSFPFQWCSGQWKGKVPLSKEQ